MRRQNLDHRASDLAPACVLHLCRRTPSRENPSSEDHPVAPAVASERVIAIVIAPPVDLEGEPAVHHEKHPPHSVDVDLRHDGHPGSTPQPEMEEWRA